jgi:hypothetical protein
MNILNDIKSVKFSAARGRSDESHGFLETIKKFELWKNGKPSQWGGLNGSFALREKALSLGKTQNLCKGFPI